MKPFLIIAYLDPGTGGYFLQLLIAFLVVAALSIKVFFKNIALFFKTRFSRKDPKTGP